MAETLGCLLVAEGVGGSKHTERGPLYKSFPGGYVSTGSSCTCGSVSFPRTQLFC